MNYEQVSDRRGRRLRGIWRKGQTYYVQLKVDGVPKRIRLDAATPAEAVLAAAVIRSQGPEVKPVARVVAPADSPTVGDLLDEYERFGRTNKRPRTIACEKTFLKEWRKSIGDLPLGELRVEQVEQHTRRRLDEGISPRSLCNERSVLRAALRYASGTARFAQHAKLDPMLIRNLDFAETETTLLTSEQVGWVIGQAEPEVVADLLTVCAFSGGRFDEVRLLRWQDVDLAGKVLIFRGETTKTRKTRCVQMSPALEDHFRRMRARTPEGREYLFAMPGEMRPRTQVWFGQRVRFAAKLAEVPGFHVHQLRHFFISHCLMNKVDLMTIRDWVGHSTLDLINDVYGKLHNEHKIRQAAGLTWGQICPA